MSNVIGRRTDGYITQKQVGSPLGVEDRGSFV